MNKTKFSTKNGVVNDIQHEYFMHKRTKICNDTILNVSDEMACLYFAEMPLDLDKQYCFYNVCIKPNSNTLTNIRK